MMFFSSFGRVTNVPRPFWLIANPLVFNPCSACRAVIRLTWYTRASSSSEASGSPVDSSPEWIFSISAR